MIVKDYSKEVIAAIERASEAGLVACAMAVEESAAYLCPVDTGRLRGSITWVTQGKQSKAKDPAKQVDGVQSKPPAGVAYVGTNVEYAAYVEFGVSAKGERSSLKTRKTFKATKGMKARSFLRAAADERREQLSAIFTQTFYRAFGKGK